ncbi:MAG: flagellar hook-basal body complex protein FliE [Planctomycetota bacterium]|nr:flagellar hook-basal body complex protein FliE [Planctomycetota bacterium]
MPVQQGTGFQDLLLNSLQQSIDAQRMSENAIESSLTGKDITQVEVLSAVKKADMSLRMMLQIRNKLLEAYNEIKQMQM